MTENVISLATRKPASADEVADDAIHPETIEAFTNALTQALEAAQRGEVTSLAMGTLRKDGGATMFVLGDSGAEMVGLTAMLQAHALSGIGFGPNE